MRTARSAVLGLAAVALAALALVAAACGGGGDEGSTTAEAAPATTAAEETAIEQATTEEVAAGNAEVGADVWGEAGCGNCHTLAAAGSTATVGPNLDDLAPSFEQVVDQVTNGGGAMPAFKDTLTEQQILDVSAFVVESTQG